MTKSLMGTSSNVFTFLAKGNSWDCQQRILRTNFDTMSPATRGFARFFEFSNNGKNRAGTLFNGKKRAGQHLFRFQKFQLLEFDVYPRALVDFSTPTFAGSSARWDTSFS
jgi:hypothetical protein